MSGAYIAWRLMTGDPRPGGALARLLGGPARRRPRVALLEASDRIGGRLHTVTQPEAPHLHAELGGMRSLQTHESVGGLARHLGLEVVDFPMGVIDPDGPGALFETPIVPPLPEDAVFFP